MLLGKVRIQEEELVNIMYCLGRLGYKRKNPKYMYCLGRLGYKRKNHKKYLLLGKVRIQEKEPVNMCFLGLNEVP